MYTFLLECPIGAALFLHTIEVFVQLGAFYAYFAVKID